MPCKGYLAAPLKGNRKPDNISASIRYLSIYFETPNFNIQITNKFQAPIKQVAERYSL
jgi:hypothetical protein